jgi:hypothetical protein
MAICRAMMLVPNQGLDQCAVLDLAYEPGKDLGLYATKRGERSRSLAVR